MQPFKVGTVVRFKSDHYAQAYGKEIYGQLSALVIVKQYSRERQSWVLRRIDGSDPTRVAAGYINYSPERYLEPDPFLNAARQAIKEAQCPTGEDNSKS